MFLFEVSGIFVKIVLFVLCWDFELSGEMGQHAHNS